MQVNYPHIRDVRVKYTPKETGRGAQTLVIETDLPMSSNERSHMQSAAMEKIMESIQPIKDKATMLFGDIDLVEIKGSPAPRLDRRAPVPPHALHIRRNTHPETGATTH